MKREIELTYSGFALNFAKSNLFKNMKKKNYEDSIFWAVELDLSNQRPFLFESLCLFCATNINASNPKIGRFLNKFRKDFEFFGKKSDEFKHDDSKDLLNQICQSIAFVVGVITFSPKDIPLRPVVAMSLDETEENLVISSTMKYNYNTLVLDIKDSCDSPFLVRILSKLTNSIIEGSTSESYRTISIILHFEKSKKYKKLVEAAARRNLLIPSKFRKSWIFFLIELLLRIAVEKGIVEIIQPWCELFIFNFRDGKKKSQLMFYIYTCIDLLSRHRLREVNCIFNREKITKGCVAIECMYSDIINARKHESNM